MKRTTCLFTVLICFTYTCTFAQKDETMKRLQAKPFPKTKKLILSYEDDKKIKYQEDSPSETPQSLPKYFSFRQTEVDLAVWIKFKNPLNISFSLSSKETDDPNIKVLSDFTTSATTEYDDLSKAFPAIGMKISIADNEELGSSIIVPEWVQRFNEHIKKQKGTPDATRLVTSKFEDLEKYLFGKFAITTGGDDRYFNNHIFYSYNALLKANSPNKFLEELEKANGILRRLNEINGAELSAKIEALKEAMANPNGFTYDAPLKEYTNAAIGKIEFFYNLIVERRAILLTAYSELLERLSKVKINGDYIVLTDAIRFTTNKDLEVIVTATPLSVDEKSLKITEGTKTESQFTVILKRAQVEVSAGIAFLSKPLEYNSFSSYKDSTKYRIGNTISNRTVLPTLFCNFYRPGNDFIYILPQVGIGSGKELPTFYVGAGFAVVGRFSITAGVANAFNQELKEKAIGDEITKEQADDVRDLYTYSWKARAYLSLQFKF